MTYSLDLRKHVLLFVEGGSGKAEASRVFGVGRCTVHNWLRRPDLAPTLPDRAAASSTARRWGGTSASTPTPCCASAPRTSACTPARWATRLGAWA